MKLSNLQQRILLNRTLIELFTLRVDDCAKMLDQAIMNEKIKCLPTRQIFINYDQIISINRDVIDNYYPGIKSSGLNKMISNRKDIMDPLNSSLLKKGFDKAILDTKRYGMIYTIKYCHLGPLAKRYCQFKSALLHVQLPTVKSLSLRLERSIERSIDRTGERSIERSNDRTGERSIDRTGERSIDRTGERSVERSVDRTGERSIPIHHYQLSYHELYPKSMFEQYQDLKLETIIKNQREFIKPILYKIKQKGFQGANISNDGILFYIDPKFLLEKTLKLYRSFFFEKEYLEELIWKGDCMKISKYYGWCYSEQECNKLGRELERYYNLWGYFIKFRYDTKDGWMELVINYKNIIKLTHQMFLNFIFV